MKTRAVIAILLCAVLATASAPRAATRRAAEDEAGLTGGEEREARELAASFVRRFAATRDFAPLLDEFFVEDLAERLRGEASAEDTSVDSFPALKFVAPETIRQLSAQEIRRFYAAVMNFYLLAEMNGAVAKFVKNEKRPEDADELETEFGDYFPPDVAAAARRDPLLARMLAEAGDSDGPSGQEAEAGRGENDGPRVLEGVGRVNEAAAVMEEVASKLRSHLKSLPAWPLARLLGADSSAGALAGDGMMTLRARRLSGPFRGEPGGSPLVCAGVLMFHVDLMRDGSGRFKILNVSSEEYDVRTDEQRRRAERLEKFLSAIKSGDADAFESILREEINVNAKEPDGWMTPLHYAATYNRPAMLKALIAAGANVNAGNRHGNAVLVYALGSPEMTAALLNAGADVSGQGGARALEFASRHNNEEAREVVRILKSYGARQ